MNPSKKKTRWVYRLVPVSVIAVLICLVSTPSEETYANKYPAASSNINTAAKEQLPHQQSERIYFITGSANEILNDIESSFTITQYFRDFKSVILRTFNILPITMDFGVFIYCLGHFIRKKKQHIPIMAISIGGHAPPKLCHVV